MIFEMLWESTSLKTMSRLNLIKNKHLNKSLKFLRRSILSWSKKLQSQSPSTPKVFPQMSTTRTLNCYLQLKRGIKKSKRKLKRSNLKNLKLNKSKYGRKFRNKSNQKFKRRKKFQKWLLLLDRLKKKAFRRKDSLLRESWLWLRRSSNSCRIKQRRSRVPKTRRCKDSWILLKIRLKWFHHLQRRSPSIRKEFFSSKNVRTRRPKFIDWGTRALHWRMSKRKWEDTMNVSRNKNMNEENEKGRSWRLNSESSSSRVGRFNLTNSQMKNKKFPKNS